MDGTHFERFMTECSKSQAISQLSYSSPFARSLSMYQDKKKKKKKNAGYKKYKPKYTSTVDLYLIITFESSICRLAFRFNQNKTDSVAMFSLRKALHRHFNYSFGTT